MLGGIPWRLCPAWLVSVQPAVPPAIVIRRRQVTASVSRTRLGESRLELTLLQLLELLHARPPVERDSV